MGPIAKRIAVIVGCLSPIIPVQYILPFPWGLQTASVIIAATIIIAFLQWYVNKKQTKQKLGDKTSKSENENNFCEKCGNTLNPKAEFCGSCGTARS